jgi:hypothetical protein
MTDLYNSWKGSHVTISAAPMDMSSNDSNAAADALNPADAYSEHITHNDLSVSE